MLRLLVAAMLAAPLVAGDAVYDLSGRLVPEEHAVVTVFGATTPFQSQVESDEKGKFHFSRLVAGTYTVAVYIPNRGEARQTVEIGPGTADAAGKIVLTLRFKDSDFVLSDALRRRDTVSTKQLAIPDAALREYQAAAKDLEKHDVDSAVKRLEHAVELAPQFAEAWNNLGTIAYQSQQFERAERCFRAALEQDPKAYEPLVNLGGVLINNNKLDEARGVNMMAVLQRPTDALANSQLGLTYFVTENFDLAIKYLEIARKLDPAHFSHPQLVLAEIYLRRGENAAAADALEDYVEHHPDDPHAGKIRESIARLRI